MYYSKPTNEISAQTDPVKMEEISTDISSIKDHLQAPANHLMPSTNSLEESGRVNYNYLHIISFCWTAQFVLLLFVRIIADAL